MDKAQSIIVLDFGGQYAHLIAKRIRHLGVYAEIMPPYTPSDKIQGACGIILSGGPASVYDPDAPLYNPDLFRSGIPVLGLCYGQQLLTRDMGGTVESSAIREFGRAELTVVNKDDLFRGLSDREEVWMSHGDSVTALPEGFEVFGHTSDCPFAAIGNADRRIYGLQFHPEVVDTPNGNRILDNFISICGCEKNWSMENFLRDKIEEIKRDVGNRRVFLLVSGGVDSTVTFVLLNRAIDQDRVQGLHIDNGFMRKNESRKVMEVLECLGFHNLMFVDKSETFLKKIAGTHDPQIKRRIIGDTFIEVWAETVGNLHLEGEEWMLGQGTLYPDIIESGGSHHADVIKTHHNRVPVISEMIEDGRVVEPLCELYKDEVREVGHLLGLPDELIWRHPFPGPGLAVRVLASDMNQSSTELAGIAEKVHEQTARFGYTGHVLPLRSVGVQGDSRTYAHPAALQGPLDYEQLEMVSTTLTNSIREINRVLVLMGGPHLTTTIVRKSVVTRERLDLLREADNLVTEILLKENIYKDIFQMPVVLIPVSADGEKESIVLRPLTSTDVMTARFARIPRRVVKEIVEKILALGNIEWVFYDLTHKPPGTFEWE